MSCLVVVVFTHFMLHDFDFHFHKINCDKLRKKTRTQARYQEIRKADT